MTTKVIPAPAYITSDWHLGHANILKYDRRPFRDTDEMATELVNRYDSLVTSTDSVLFLGDMFFSASRDEARAIMDSLLGSKTLIRGNHDRRTAKWYRDVGFDDVLDAAVIEGAELGAILFVHNPLHCVRYKYSRYVVHGHRHSHEPQPRGPESGWVDVGVTAWDFYPAPYGKVVSMLRNA